jgi:flagellar basal-body rod protein FlgC
MMENAQAMNAFSVSQQVSANNVANANTEGFRSSRVEYESGPDGRGVRVSDITENPAPGRQVRSREFVETEEGRRYEETFAEGSNTDLATEMVQMMENERNFAANAEAVRAQMEMEGRFIDMMV